MSQSSHVTAKQLAQVRHTLYWAAGTAVATYLLWAIGDPWLLDHFGRGAPWWAYLLLSMRLVGGLVHMWVQDLAMCREWSEEHDDPAVPAANSPAPDYVTLEGPTLR